MADISVLVGQEVSKDRDVIFGVTRSVASQNALSAGLQEDPLHLLANGQVDLYGLGAKVKVTDTVTASLNPEVPAASVESIRITDTVTVYLNPEIASLSAENLKVQDQTPLASLGDLLVLVPAENIRVLDMVMLPPLYAVPKAEGMRIREDLFAFKPATGNLSIAVQERLKVADGNTSQGPYGGTGFTGNEPNTNDGAHLPWTNPHKANLSDDDNVTIIFDSPDHNPAISDWLKATGFGFSIPSGARITGFLVQVEHTASIASNVGVDIVQLIQNGVRSGGVHLRGGFWNAPEIVDSYGGPDDRWPNFVAGQYVDNGWTPANVNDPGFGAGDRIGGDNDTLASIDWIGITVYYRDPNSLDVAIVDIFDELLHVQDTVLAFLGDLAVVVPAETIKVSDSVAADEALRVSVSEVLYLSDQPPFIEERLRVSDSVSAALVAAGGDLTRTVDAENLKVQDTVTVLENPLFSAPAVESLKVQDAVTLLENPLFAAPSVESLKVQDTVTPSENPLFAAPVVESLKVQDTVTASKAINASGFDELLHVQDTVTVELSDRYVVVLSELLHVSDADLTVAIGMDEILHCVDQIPIASLTGGGNLTATAGPENLKLADTVTVLENPLFAAPSIEPVIVQDTATLFENPLFAAPAVEALKVQDQTPLGLIGGLTVLISPDELLHVVDTVSASLTVLRLSVGDENIKVQDQTPTASITGPGELNVSAESLKVQDAVTSSLDPEIAAPAVDSLKISDSVTAAIERSVAVSDESLKVSDAVIVALGISTSTPDESLKISDSVSASMTVLLVVVTSETIKVSESIQLGVDLLSVGVASENLEIRDIWLVDGTRRVLVKVKSRR